MEMPSKMMIKSHGPATAPLAEVLRTAVARDLSDSRDGKGELSQQIVSNINSNISQTRKRKLLNSSPPPATNNYLSNILCNSAPSVSRKRPRVLPQLKTKSVRFEVPAANEGKNAPTTSTVIPRSVGQEDLPNVWYNKTDYKAFREDSHSLALVFELGILDRIHPDDFCLRGLEASLSSCHLQARVEARTSVIECVLRTQEAQKGLGMKDPEMIRGLSLVLSKDAREDALKLAAFDQEEAIAVLEEGGGEEQEQQQR